MCQKKVSITQNNFFTRKTAIFAVFWPFQPFLADQEGVKTLIFKKIDVNLFFSIFFQFFFQCKTQFFFIFFLPPPPHKGWYIVFETQKIFKKKNCRHFGVFETLRKNRSDDFFLILPKCAKKMYLLHRTIFRR